MSSLLEHERSGNMVEIEIAAKRTKKRIDSGFSDFESHSAVPSIVSRPCRSKRTSKIHIYRQKHSSVDPIVAGDIGVNSGHTRSSDLSGGYVSNPDQLHSRRGSLASSTKSRTKMHKEVPSCHQTSTSNRKFSLASDLQRSAGPYRTRTYPASPSKVQDIDQILALHQRSCSIFHPGPPMLDRSTSQGLRSCSSSTYRDPTLSSSFTNFSPSLSEEEPDPEPFYDIPPATVIHWTSPHTRRREYEEIDASQRGLRGLWRKIAPKWLTGPGPGKFYDGSDDSRSVRRYRLELPTENEETPVDEKGGKWDKVVESPRKGETWSCF